MAKEPTLLLRIWNELKRRRVTKVVTVYAASAFIIMEASEIMLPRLGLPDWIVTLIIIILIVGLPVAVIFSWIFDITPEGIEKTKSIKEESIAGEVDITNKWKVATIASILIIIGLLAYNIFGSSRIAKIDKSLEKSIAVLPFLNYSGDPDQDYICIGLPEEVISNLYAINSLERVTPFRSVLKYLDSKDQLSNIASELNVEYILSGTYKKLREQLRFTVQLFQAKESELLWQEHFDIPPDEINGIPSEIALHIADYLNAYLSDSERQTIQKPSTPNPEAYEKFQLGNYYYYIKQDNSRLDIAIDYFNVCIELDPEFAMAYIMKARSYLVKHWYRIDMTDKSLRESEKAIALALEIDPSLPLAHLVRGQLCYLGYRDYDSAIHHLNHALSLTPGNAEIIYFLGLVHRRTGNWNRAIDEIKKAHSIDPGTVAVIMNLMECYFLTRQYESALGLSNKIKRLTPENLGLVDYRIHISLMRDGNTMMARKELEQAIRIGITELELNNHSFFTPPMMLDYFDGMYQKVLDYISNSGWNGIDNHSFYQPANLLQAFMYDCLGNREFAKLYFDSARMILDSMVNLYPDEARLYGSLGLACAGVGDKENAILRGKKAVELLSIEKDAFIGTNRVWELAWIYVMVKEYDKALEQLEILLSHPSSFSSQYLLMDPRWEPLRNQPEFIRITEIYSQ
jgi:TolB-like protein/Flp pilus assembly protein TadD